MIHYISADHLTVGRVEEILTRGYELALSDDARNRIQKCRDYLDRKAQNPERPIYGVTTGFGSLCTVCEPVGWTGCSGWRVWLPFRDCMVTV